MSETMLSKSPPIEKPLHTEQAVESPTMEVHMSQLGAKFGRMLDKLEDRSKDIRDKSAAEMSVFGSRCVAFWKEMRPALVRAWADFAEGVKRACADLATGAKEGAKGWQHPESPKAA